MQKERERERERERLTHTHTHTQVHTLKHTPTHKNINEAYKHTHCICIERDTHTFAYTNVFGAALAIGCGVASISRLLKIIGLFCKKAQ